MTNELTSTSIVGSLFRSAVAALRAASARRAQRIALGELLRMDPSRLDDLGINQQDVVEALSAPPPAGPRLEARRNARVSNALTTAAA